MASGAKALGATLILASLVASFPPSGASAQTVGGNGGSAEGNAGGAGGGLDQIGTSAANLNAGGGGGGPTSTATQRQGGFGNGGGGAGGAGGATGFFAGVFSSIMNYAGTGGTGGGNGTNAANTGSGGGGGGAGGYGAILTGTGAFGTTAQITGGTGGTGGYGSAGYGGGYGYGGGGNGGGGGIGLLLGNGAGFMVGPGATITGGIGGLGGNSTNGAAGAMGGAGGAGVYSSSTELFTNNGTLTGGQGGGGGDTGTGVGGRGGDAGSGFHATAAGAALTNAGTIQGGPGGTGGENGALAYGGGGPGGDGVRLDAAGTVTNQAGAFIYGGGGGGGGPPTDGGGTGGIGVFGLAGGTLANLGTIVGGTGGGGGDGGDGVRFLGAAMVTNSGSITAGAGTTGLLTSGIGGIGVNLQGGGSLTNSGTITGGDPTAGPSPTGGAGVNIVGGATGGTLINSGTITGGPAMGGTGGVGVTGSNLAITNSGMISRGTGGAPNAITFTGGVNSLTLVSSPTFAIAGNAVAVLNGSDALRLGGPTSSTFDTTLIGTQYQNFSVFQKIDASTWTLANTPTQTVTPWQVLGGTLAISQDASLGAASGGLLLNGGTLQTTADIPTSTRTITLGASGGTIQTDPGTTFASSGAIMGPGGLTKTGAGTFTVSGPNTYTGPTLVAAGTFQGGAANVFSQASAFTVNSTLNLGGFAQAIGSLAGTGTITNNGAAPADLTVGANGTSTAFSGTLVNGTNPLGLIKTGTGTFSLSGVSTYSGGTRIKEGVLSINNGGALGSGGILMDNGSTLAFTGTGYTLANPIRFTGLLDPTFDSGPGTVTISGPISGGADLSKIGTGTLILSGANTYTGNTFIDQGTLQVDGSIASSPLTVVGSTAILSGIGTVGGISARSGSFVIPGNAANPYGVLSATGPVTLGAGSNLGIASSPTTASRLVTSATATIAPGGGLVVSPGAVPYTTPVRLPILVAGGGLNGQFTSVTFTNQVIGLQPTVVYDANDAYLQFGGPGSGPNLDLLNSIAAGDKLARQRFGEFATLRVLASVLQGFNQQINCSDCVTGFGSGGSFSFGVQGRKAIGDDFAIVGGVAYADYESGGIHVRSAPIIAGLLRWDPTAFGTSRPFVDIGGFVAPSQNASYGRAYTFGNMTGGGGANSNTTSTSAFARLGYVSRLTATDEVAVFAEISRGWQSTGGYTESVLAPNPYPLTARRGEDRLNIVKGGAQYTHLWGTKIETQLNIGVAHAFDTESGLKGSTIGGTALAPRIGDYTWAEYGMRLGYRITDNWVLDGFANGTLGAKPIGDTIHGGIGARYVF